MNVPNTIKKSGCVLKGSLYSNGYRCIHLRGRRKEKNALVHRLVAQAFIPNPKNLPEVNHIDGNKLNNNVENLEWCTRRDNQIHSIRVLGNPKPPRPKVSPNRHLTFEQAQKIREDNRIQSEIAEEYGVPQSSISLIKRGITYTKED